jgi:signal transduction histidine kinase
MKALQRSRAVESFYENRLFEGLDVEIIERIAPKIDIARKKPGEIIYREGQVGRSLYLVGEGLVKISKPGEVGGHEIIDYVDQGNFFGASSLLVGEPHVSTATVTQSALIGAVREETFEELLELAPARLHMNFLRAFSARLRSANDHFVRETIRAERMRVAGAVANAVIHDLKNPVCIARCCSDLIANESIDPQLRELSSMLTDAVNGLLGTTSDLFDYSRGSLSLNKRPVSIWRLLDELNRQSLHLLTSRNIKFVKQIRYENNVEIDLDRFARALGNVIENSVQAISRGGVITFTTDVIADSVVVRISDNGRGISPEVLTRLFEPFDNRDDSDSASLGLAVTKAIIEAHGGKISVGSVVGKGTTVDIRLPKPASE